MTAVAGPINGRITRAIIAKCETSPLEEGFINRRFLDEHDVNVEIYFCGICHSDLHVARNDWKTTNYPVVPGHEITGFVEEVGKNVKKLKIGDRVAVGTFIDTCRKCHYCKTRLNQYCDKGVTLTFGSKYLKDGGVQTCGGYSSHIVVDENYVFKLPESLPMDKIAPVLCAGITVYSPLRHFNVNANSKVAVAGLGGLGHMAVKLAHAMKAEVTVISRSKSKEEEAKALGAKHFIISTDKSAMSTVKSKFNVIIDTISASHDIMELIRLLAIDGSLVIVGLPPSGGEIKFGPLVNKRKSVVGSYVGSTSEVEELLEFCAKHSISADVEIIPVSRVNEAYDRLAKGDVHYRFVMDMKTMK